MKKDLAPVNSEGRIHLLDVYRGFAILGIFLVNILVMNCGFSFRLDWESEQIGWLNQASFFFLETFTYSKFFPIFSFLFGLGVAFQIQRAREKGSFSILFFTRRFLVLFMIGACHILFIWSGDILHLYAIIGFLLLVFTLAKPKIILMSAIIVFLFPYHGMVFNEIIDFFNLNIYGPLGELSRNEIIELKRNGSYYSGIVLRLKEYLFATELLYSGIGPTSLSMALLGAYIVKKGILLNLEQFAQRIKIPFLICIVILVSYRFVFVYAIIPNIELVRGSWESLSLYTVFILSDISIALFYLWLIAILFKYKLWNRLLSPLKFVGRMALSNYILQSIIGFILMRVFSMYELFNPFETILIVFAVFAFQIILSKIWLRSFKYGPLEWMWRSLSYGKLLKFKL